MRHHLRSLCVDRQGTTAVEFAIVAPVFIAMVLGTIGCCGALFMVGSMHFAVEDAARCWSVGTLCPDKNAAKLFAERRYFGPGVPEFTPDDKDCAHRVTGSINYSLNVGFKTFAIPISA